MIQTKRPPKVRKNQNGFLKTGFYNFHIWYRSRVDSPLDKVTSRKVTVAVFNKCWEKMIKEYWVMKFPLNLGSLYIRESTSLVASHYKDWSRTVKGGRLKWAYCHETDGRKPFVKYQRSRGVPVKYASAYKFRPVRGSFFPIRGYKGLWGWIKSQNTKSYRPNIL